MILVPLMSCGDVIFTFWYLRTLQKKGVPNVHNRELNPLGKLLFKKLGIGRLSFFISIIYTQLLIITLGIITPTFIFVMFGVLYCVVTYHYAIYKEIKMFDKDKRYWAFVKYKLKKVGR
jgi:hypothetical protein